MLKLLALILTAFTLTACQTGTPENDTQAQTLLTDTEKQAVLTTALGQLNREYVRIFGYTEGMVLLDVSQMADKVYGIYESDVQPLGKDYCGEYFYAVALTIPIKGGELNALADTIATECGQKFIDKSDNFLQVDAEYGYRKKYDPELYWRMDLMNGLVKSWMKGLE